MVLTELPAPGRAPPSRDPRAGPRGLRLALALVLTLVVIGSRWGWAHNGRGPALYPFPDAVEYAAGAQSLVDSGRYYLQVGSIEAQPRYPPGWSLVLAAGLGLGLEASQLWRLTTLLGALTAWVVALLAIELAGASLDAASARRSTAIAVAGAVAGLAWALSPLATTVGQMVMSDEPSSLLQAVLVLAAMRLVAAPAARRWALAAGLAAGLLLLTRPVELALLAAPILVAVSPWSRRPTRRPDLPIVATMVVGALLPLGVAAWILWRSGFPPTSFGAYGFWVPEWLSPPSRAFDWRTAWIGTPSLAGPERTPPGHLGRGLRWVLGLPGEAGSSVFAAGWPPLAWIGGAVLSARGALGARGRLVLVAAAVWTLLHLGFYAGYFVPAGRFYLATGIPVAVLAGLLAAFGVARSRNRWAAGATALVLVGWLALSLAAQRHHRDLDPRPDPGPEVAAEVARWLALPEATRQAGRAHFDSVRAQAMGLLPCDVVRTVTRWGRPMWTAHAVRLARATGVEVLREADPQVDHPRAHPSWCGGRPARPPVAGAVP